MSKEELLAELNEISVNEGDAEKGHMRADFLLLEYIDDTEVANAFYAIKRWYS